LLDLRWATSLVNAQMLELVVVVELVVAMVEISVVVEGAEVG
jgi:hypothetical protein